MPLLAEVRAALLYGFSRAFIGGFALAGDPVAQLFRVTPPADPYPILERIRARGELVPTRFGMHASMSYPVCGAVLRDPRFGVMAGEDLLDVDWARSAGERQRLAHPIEHSLLGMNPPEHSRLRRLATPAFTPRRLRARRGKVEQTVREFLDGIAVSGEFDLMRDFALRVPVRVICELLGVPEADHASFVRWGTVLGDTLDGPRTLAERRDVRTAVIEMGEFFDGLIADRRREPGDDVITELINAEPDGEPLTHRELVATAGLLIGAGFETTVNLIGNGVLALQDHPEYVDALVREPEFAPKLVEEILRFDPPVQHTARIAREDVTVAGTALARGSVVLLSLAGANRDPRVFSDPLRFDPHRENNHDHLAFSSGVHYCLGSNLARMEGEIALRELFTRFPDLHRTGKPARRRSRTLRGLATMPMTIGNARKTVAA